MQTKKKIIIVILVLFIIGLIGAGVYLVINPTPSSIPASQPKTTPSSSSIPASQPKTTPSSSVLPFRIGVSKETPMNEDGGGKAVYLDRHDIDCQENPINQLLLSRNNEEGNNYNYKYTCSQGGNLNTSIDFSNNPSEASYNAIFLDRQPVSCEKDSVLSRLRLRTLGDGTWTYDYKCKKSNSPLTCTDKSTPLNEEAGGNAIFLDRHNIQCDANESLSALALVRNGQGQWQYKYKCCKYPTSEPFSFNTPQYLRHLQNKNFLLY